MKRNVGLMVVAAASLVLAARPGAFAASDSVSPSLTNRAGYGARLAQARAEYFKDLAGDHDADVQARADFASLAQEQPGDAVVMAYSGSLDLLEAGRTWVVWNKHALTEQGLDTLDRAVERDPENVEARFIRAATTWHLPFFLHRHDQAESDFAYIAPRAENAVAAGTLPSELGAAALDYYGQVLIDRSDRAAARSAFEVAVRIDKSSPGGKDASRRLQQAD